MNILHTIGAVIDTMRAAAHVASAIELRRAPAARDLKKLGIDTETFRAIHL